MRSYDDLFPDLPNRAKVLHDFARDHALRGSGALRAVATPTCFVEACDILLALAWAEHTDRLELEATSGLLMNLLHRNRQRVVGGLVCIAADCGAAAEAAARAAIEMSSSILFILAGDRCRRLFSYFCEHVAHVRSELERWRAIADRDHGNAREMQLASIAYRKSLIGGVAELLQSLREPLGIPDDERAQEWPKISQRFESLGLSNSYRTVYARLCAQVHGDAEDTLGEFIAVAAGGDELVLRYRTESFQFSRFMVCAAASFYLRSASAFMLTFNTTKSIPVLREANSVLDAEMIEISKEMGVPDDVMDRFVP